MNSTYDSLNNSMSSLCMDELSSSSNHTVEEDPKQLSGIKRGVFVSYGMRSFSAFIDVDESLSEVKRVVESKMGIPMEDQVLAWENNGKEVKDDKTLRTYGLLGGAFCKLSKA